MCLIKFIEELQKSKNHYAKFHWILVGHGYLRCPTSAMPFNTSSIDSSSNGSFTWTTLFRMTWLSSMYSINIEPWSSVDTTMSFLTDYLRIKKNLCSHTCTIFYHLPLRLICWPLPRPRKKHCLHRKIVMMFLLTEIRRTSPNNKAVKTKIKHLFILAILTGLPHALKITTLVFIYHGWLWKKKEKHSNEKTSGYIN